MFKRWRACKKKAFSVRKQNWLTFPLEVRLKITSKCFEMIFLRNGFIELKRIACHSIKSFPTKLGWQFYLYLGLIRVYPDGLRTYSARTEKVNFFKTIFRGINTMKFETNCGTRWIFNRRCALRNLFFILQNRFREIRVWDILRLCHHRSKSIILP